MAEDRDRRKLKPPPPVTKGPSGVRRETRDVEVRPTVAEVDPNFDPNLVLDKTRVDFREEKFIEAIRQKGYRVTWRKAMLCVCFNPETEQSRIRGACDICDGSGYFFIDPHEIQAIMTGLTKSTDIYRKPGKWLSGQSAVTVEPQYRLGYRDSIEMLDSVSTFNEFVIKGNRRGIRKKLPKGVDAARFRIVRVNALMFADSNLTPVRFEPEFHFKIQKDGWIEWTPEGNKVADGTVFSIHYEFHPVYVVTSHPHAVRDTITSQKKKRPTVLNLPIQATVQLDYLFDVNTALPSTSVC